METILEGKEFQDVKGNKKKKNGNRQKQCHAFGRQWRLFRGASLEDVERMLQSSEITRNENITFSSFYGYLFLQSLKTFLLDLAFVRTSFYDVLRI